jgi:hypothetical protein
MPLFATGRLRDGGPVQERIGVCGIRKLDPGDRDSSTGDDLKSRTGGAFAPEGPDPGRQPAGRLYSLIATTAGLRRGLLVDNTMQLYWPEEAH